MQKVQRKAHSGYAFLDRAHDLVMAFLLPGRLGREEFSYFNSYTINSEAARHQESKTRSFGETRGWRGQTRSFTLLYLELCRIASERCHFVFPDIELQVAFLEAVDSCIYDCIFSLFDSFP
jgi:hypothetical protein